MTTTTPRPAHNDRFRSPSELVRTPLADPVGTVLLVLAIAGPAILLMNIGRQERLPVALCVLLGVGTAAHRLLSRAASNRGLPNDQLVRLATIPASALAVAAAFIVLPAITRHVDRLSTSALLVILLLAGALVRTSARPRLGRTLGVIGILAALVGCAMLPSLAERYVGLSTPSAPYSDLSFTGRIAVDGAAHTDGAFVSIAVRYATPAGGPLPTARFRGAVIVPETVSTTSTGSLLTYRVAVPTACSAPFDVTAPPSASTGSPPDASRSTLRIATYVGPDNATSCS